MSGKNLISNILIYGSICFLQLRTLFTSVKKRLLSQSIWKIQLASFVLVALIPILFLSINLYRLAWDNAWREVSEKHQLLAMNMAAPVHNYVIDHQAMLKVIAHSIQFESTDQAQHRPALIQLVESTLKNFTGYQSIALINSEGDSQFVMENKLSPPHAPLPGNIYNESVKPSLKDAISGITSSPINQKPTIILTEPILNTKGEVFGVLLAELKINALEKLRKNIHFGEKGHSAIVDGQGHVIAHPNPDWMVEMKDLSHWPVVQKMMLGKTGVTEFYSPFIKANMVAGYTGIPTLGWGIMVPQPKSEIEAQVKAMMYSNYTSIFVGLLFALGLSWLLVKWISRPIMQLSKAALNLSLATPGSKLELPTITDNAPKEIQQLSLFLHDLVKSQQNSQQKIKELNLSLQSKVNQATSKLRQANKELGLLAHSDHLTGLYSRRYFIDELILNSKQPLPGRNMCVLLIDLDDFKSINDTYGHNAGDSVLVKIASLLCASTDSDDITARYGGDELAAILYCSISDALEFAEKLRVIIEQEKFEWQQHCLKMTVTIGVFSVPEEGIKDVLSILENVDAALYYGKRAGRNIIIEYNSELETQTELELRPMAEGN
jgi:diguanylate cyclase (GGDEF)-like protein